LSERTNAPQQHATSVTIFHSELERQAGLVAGKLAGATADATISIAADIFGGLIGDRVRQWRNRNLINSLAKTADILKEKGIPLDKAKVLPMGEAYAMFENASKQDEPAVSDLWAGLLANAMDPDSDTTIEPALVETLKSFSGCEAALMEFLWKRQDLFEEYSRSKPPFPNVQSVDEKETIDMYKEEVDRLDGIFRQNTIENFERLLGGKSDGELHNAVRNLINLRCIFVPVRRVLKSQLIQTSYVDRHRVEEVHPDRVVNAISSLASALEDTMGRVKRGADVAVINPVHPRYVLTEYGARLMVACH
jgi:Abortive infection alpha